MALIPQLHNGGTVSQTLGQMGCPSGESESLGPHMPICEDYQQCWSGPGLESLECQAGQQKSWPCYVLHLGFPPLLARGLVKSLGLTKVWKF